MFDKRPIAVIVPAFNEADKIVNTLRPIPDFVQHIIVVDDASHDATAALAAAVERKGLEVTVLDHNRGVWAWNVALACAALTLACSHRRAQTGSSSALAALALLWPLLYPLGLAAPSTALFVYGGLEPVTLACDRFERCTLDREQRHTLAQLGVPIPGDVALLHASFQASCAPGDRWLARRRGGDEAVLARARCGEPLTHETGGPER